MNLQRFFFLICISSIVLLSCGNSDEVNTKVKFGVFTVLEDEISVEMNGEIGSNSLANFNKLTANYPNIKLINIKMCDGSSDDDINLKLSLKVHLKGINTHLMDNGLIASGGVDFFLAGVKRTKGSNTKIGVHSWAGDNEVAREFPVGHPNHLPYINYYVSVGFTQKLAEDFYYFTINAAEAESMHWMTETEINQYGLITP